MAKRYSETIFGLQPKSFWALVGVVFVFLAIVACAHYGVFDKQTTLPNGNSDDLKLEKEFKSMKIDSTVVADDTANYNSESGVIAIQIDAEKSSTSTQTTFTIKAADVNSDSVSVKSATQTGVLSTPSTAVTVPVTVEFDLSWTDGFTNTNQILTSSVSASASSLKSADGVKFSPVVKKNKNETPAVYVNDNLKVKNFTWTSSDDSKSVIVSFDLDWEGIDQMTSISDEVKIPIAFTNTDSPTDVTIRIIKNSAL